MKRSNKNKKIRNVKDLQIAKDKIQKRMKIRNKLLNKHLNDFNEDLSASYLFRQGTDLLNVNNRFINTIPSLLKNKKLGKSFFISLFSGIGVSMLTLYILKKKSKKNKSSLINDQVKETKNPK